MRRLTALVLCLALLAGCAPADGRDGSTRILCTTYPVYLFTTAVVGDAGDVEVELLVNQQTSCLHNYTLTVEDMKAIQRADVIVVNGAGLEDFMADALGQGDAAVIDCSENVRLLPALEHEGHHHGDGDEDAPDPHIWMDPDNAQRMLDNIARGLEKTLDGTGGDLRGNYQAASRQLAEAAQTWQGISLDSGFVSFHDGFQYFCHAFGLDLLRAIEEEEGAEASAKELEELVLLVREQDIPAIFVEKNGARRSAGVIARETGCKVYELDMVMSGDGVGIAPYLDAMGRNIATVREALG